MDELTNRYKRVSDWVYYFGVTPLLAVLPKKTGYSLVRRQARCIRKANPIYRQEATRNVSLVLDDEIWSALAKAEIADRAFEAVATEDLETFYLPFWNEDSIEKYYTFEGLEKIDKARSLRRGALLFTGAMGCVSSALAALGVRGYQCNHISRDWVGGEETLHPARLAHRRFKLKWMKKRIGRDPIYFDPDPDASPSPFLEANRFLAQNEIVSIPIDLPPEETEETAKVEFLGRQCLFSTMLVRIAYESKAPVLPFFALRNPKELWSQRIIIDDPVTMTGRVEEDLRACCERLADMVQVYPDQWQTWRRLNSFWTEAPASADAESSAA